MYDHLSYCTYRRYYYKNTMLQTKQCVYYYHDYTVLVVGTYTQRENRNARHTFAFYLTTYSMNYKDQRSTILY